MRENETYEEYLEREQYYFQKGLRMKISHEVPMSMLEESKKFNDYDYALVHLFKTRPDYLKFYQDAIKEGRVVYLDNSCFELGASVDNEVLLEGVKLINPTFVIAPDFLDDMTKTLEATLRFKKQMEENDLSNNIMYVVQGATYEEYVECYKEMKAMMKDGDMFALPFDIKCFHTEASITARTKSEIYALSRNILIDRMIKDGVIDRGVRHHLLGCSDPIEFMHYNQPQYDFIESVDTSCPIMLAMFGETLPEYGLGKEKLKPKLADNLDFVFEGEKKELLYNNVKTFKHYYLGRRDV